MSEEQTTLIEAKEEVVEATQETIKPEDVDNLKVLAKRIESANQHTMELLKRQEELMSHKILGGQTEAGASPKEKTAEEKSIESARAMLKGTGYDDLLFPVENK